MGKIEYFYDLDAWKKGHKLVLDIYEVTKLFPREEMYGLVSQMRRCSVSITSNISEGFCRQSYKEKIKFYYMSLGSVNELQNQLIIARDTSCITHEKYEDVYSQSLRVHKIINGLIKRSKNMVNKGIRNYE